MSKLSIGDRVKMIDKDSHRTNQEGILVDIKKFGWSHKPYYKVRFDNVIDGISQENWFFDTHLEITYNRNLIRLETNSLYK